MKASTHTWETFYRKLAHLFYSVAASHRDITREELNALHEEVNKIWVPLESSQDNFGTDAAYQIEFAFDWIMDNAVKSDKAFQVFEDYYKENPELFGEDITQRIYATTDHIASAFHGEDKAEHAILMRTRVLLGRAEVL